MRNCYFCKKELTSRQAKFCSKKCVGLSFRGSGDSYIRIRVNGRRVYLHRYVFETHFRPLKDGEIVHHKDENKFNNAPENLEALSGQAAHLHAHNYFKDRRARGASAGGDYDPNFGF